MLIHVAAALFQKTTHWTEFILDGLHSRFFNFFIFSHLLVGVAIQRCEKILGSPSTSAPPLEPSSTINNTGYRLIWDICASMSISMQVIYIYDLGNQVWGQFYMSNKVKSEKKNKSLVMFLGHFHQWDSKRVHSPRFIHRMGGFRTTLLVKRTFIHTQSFVSTVYKHHGLSILHHLLDTWPKHWCFFLCPL